MKMLMGELTNKFTSVMSSAYDNEFDALTIGSMENL